MTNAPECSHLTENLMWNPEFEGMHLPLLKRAEIIYDGSVESAPSDCSAVVSLSDAAIKAF